VTGVITIILAALIAGSIIYCILTALAARNYLLVSTKRRKCAEPVSILKPLYGSDEGLEENLRSFFRQDYPEFEILMSVRRSDDPEALTARRVMDEFPGVSSLLVVTGDSPRPNGKVYALQSMIPHARHNILLMADSDIRVTPSMTSSIAAEFGEPSVGLVTCPYRAVPGSTLWSRMEAVGMNTEFLGGVLVARLLGGMTFALGCTLAVRREALHSVGGMEALQDYLAEDFMLGKLVASNGSQVILSSYTIEHRIGGQSFRKNLRHRLRWARSTRRSRPWGYVGQIFTNPLPLAALLLAANPAWWPLAAAALAFRIAAAWAVAGQVLRDPLTANEWYLVPLQDFASFVTWTAGFFGNTVEWRGRRHEVLPNGMFKSEEVGDAIQIGRITAAAPGGGRGRRRREAGTATPGRKAVRARTRGVAAR
jgi:ceramide glucosyltransferase